MCRDRFFRKLFAKRRAIKSDGLGAIAPGPLPGRHPAPQPSARTAARTPAQRQPSASPAPAQRQDASPAPQPSARTPAQRQPSASPAPGRQPGRQPSASPAPAQRQDPGPGALGGALGGAGRSPGQSPGSGLRPEPQDLDLGLRPEPQDLGLGAPLRARLSPDFPRFRAQIQVLAGPGETPPKRQISSKSAPKVLQKCSPYDPLQRALLRGFGGGSSAGKNILRPLIRATKMANDRPSRGPFWQKSCKNPHENACFFRNFAKPRFFARALF